MSLRSAPIRRCGFKLPKNDKYQYQKKGDKFQPMVELWYCGLHDSHAQDRCQVLVEWAGMGAQCELLGTFDRSSGEKLCECHATQNMRDIRLEKDNVDSELRNDSAQGSVDHEDDEGPNAAIPDDPTSEEEEDESDTQASFDNSTLDSDVADHEDLVNKGIESVNGTTSSCQSTHVRMNLLSALQDQEASTPNRIATMYAQCCVCLERHGEFGMRQIALCNHRYRDLCLIKATKQGSMRRFNCSSCKAWMAEQQEEVVKSPGL